MPEPFMPSVKKLFISLTVGVAMAGILCPVAAEDSTAPTWPDTVVKFEDLRPLTNFELLVPGLVRKGRVTGPAILRVHVTAEGTVARTALLASCGNPDLDEASIHAMRRMRFEPHTYGGVPIEVTLLAPVHVPPRLGRSPR